MSNFEGRWHSIWLETTIVACFLWPVLGFSLGITADGLIPPPIHPSEMNFTISCAVVGFMYAVWGGWLIGVAMSVFVGFVTPSHRWGSRSLVRATTEGMVLGAVAFILGAAVFLGFIAGFTGRSNLSRFLETSDALDTMIIYITPATIIVGGVARAAWKTRSD